MLWKVALALGVLTLTIHTHRKTKGEGITDTRAPF